MNLTVLQNDKSMKVKWQLPKTFFLSLSLSAQYRFVLVYALNVNTRIMHIFLLPPAIIVEKNTTFLEHLLLIRAYRL